MRVYTPDLERESELASSRSPLHLPVNSRLDPDDDAAAAAAGATRRCRIDRVLDPPMVAFAGLVDQEDELPRPRARRQHIAAHAVVFSGCACRSCRRREPAALLLPGGALARFNNMLVPSPRR